MGTKEMTDFLRVVLPIYFIIYFGVVMVLKSVIVAKRTGVNPYVLPKDDSTYGLVGFYFKVLVVALLLYAFAYAFFPAWYEYFLPIIQLAKPEVSYIGLTLIFISFVWTVVAQIHMKDSWRIGIDSQTGTKTELITSGVFSISRNPVFLGMLIALLGLFFTTPNALTALFFILGYVIIQVQIRLEEEFLTQEHGQEYLNYKKRVRRLI